MAPEPEHHHHLFHDEMDAQHKRDTEQLAKFGYKQDLRRSLGFFSTFAIAFSFISATNGFYALFYYGLGIGGPAGLIWQWPIIVFGQFMVALVFAEAASHYPLAGGLYQWAKRFMGGTYGWFVAWIFAAALLVTVAAVAFGVAPIVCSLLGWDASNSTTLLWIAVAFALGPMILNILSVKVTAFFNNIGTVTEIIGLVVIAIALYAAVIFGKGDHQSLSVLFDTTPGAGGGAVFGYGSIFLASMLTGAWVLYGFDSAGGLAEETVNPTREVPRAMLFAIGITAVDQRVLAGGHGAGHPGRRQDPGRRGPTPSPTSSTRTSRRGSRTSSWSPCAWPSSSAAWRSRRRRRACCSPTAATR